MTKSRLGKRGLCKLALKTGGADAHENKRIRRRAGEVLSTEAKRNQLQRGSNVGDGSPGRDTGAGQSLPTELYAGFTPR